MRLITRKPLREAAEKYPKAADALEDFWKLIEKGVFATPEDLRKVIPSLDNHKDIDRYYVINICRNSYRLIVKIDFKHQVVYVKHVFTHKEYDVFNAKHKGGSKK
ncbi:type II toxin-antitoxin system HigB family toxin [Buttiauxella noackiae]|uniref:type II toxin-antitoxin system HigB family toxin n=1 Tax=Buttiauxella noackiae TaxID=82992 RepID=UPI0035A5E4B2